MIMKRFLDSRRYEIKYRLPNQLIPAVREHLRGHVVLDAGARADTIRAEAESLAFAQGLELIDDPALLSEVAGLVEYPVVLVGEIAEDFASLPPEVLQTSMREHQKFFSLRDPESGRITRFVTVANRETADHGATILAGDGTATPLGLVVNQGDVGKRHHRTQGV